MFDAKKLSEHNAKSKLVCRLRRLRSHAKVFATYGLVRGHLPTLQFFKNDTERLEKLFELYAKVTR